MMTGKKKEEKRKCKFELEDYKCNRPLFDDEYCIFHSKDVEGKQDAFMDAFWKEYESQKEKKSMKFTGFVFAKGADLQNTNLQRAILFRADLSGAKLIGANLRKAYLREAKLNDAIFSKTHPLDLLSLEKGFPFLDNSESEFDYTNPRMDDLQNVDLERADLKNTDLQMAILRGANLYRANLQGANLQGAELEGAFLGEANLQGCDLHDANLHMANLQNANLYRANLQGTFFLEANLQGANLKEADLYMAELGGANLRGSSFEKASVTEINYNRFTECMGIDVANAKGSPKFVRFAKDQEFLEELQNTRRGKFIYTIWYIFADCGRSFLRWALWSVLFAVFFALIYHCAYLSDQSAFKSDYIHDIWPGFSFLYYSIVTFTTLGFGDIVPKPGWMQFWVMLEVILGYIMLGGLISILANKLARRS